MVQLYLAQPPDLGSKLGRRSRKPATSLLRYGTTLTNAIFEILTGVTTKNSVFWDVTPCSQVEIHRHFGGRANIMSSKAVSP